MTETVGGTIKRARVAMRLTQEQLAHRVGVTRVAVSEWERDLTVPRVSKAKKLAQVLGVSELDLTPLVGLQRGEPSDSFDGMTGLQWSEVPRLLQARAHMQTIHQAGETNGQRPSVTIYYDLTIEDDSMAPEFQAGDQIRIDTTLEPWDGCQVVAVVDGNVERGVLRHYRLRPGGFDLWPTNPKHPTHTITDGVSAHVLGVVDRHVRVIRPPSRGN